MKQMLIFAPLAAALSLAGCATSSTSTRTVAGAGIGAGIGAVAGTAVGAGPFEGAVLGAAAGGAVGALVKGPLFHGRDYRRDTKGYCYYVDRKGRVVYDYKARC